MQPQALEIRHELRGGNIGEVERHGARLGLQIEQHLVDHLLAEVDPALERRVDLDIEPRLDRARQELHRHGVDDKAWQHGERGEAQEEPQRKAGAENARPIASCHDAELINHQGGEHGGEGGIEREEQRILLREEGGVAARRGEQEQAHRRDAAAEDQHELHRASSRGSRLSTGAGTCRGERTMKRFQCDSSCSSRLVSALTWKGLGSSVLSRRMRTAAS